MTTSLKTLAQLILKNCEILDDSCAKRGIPVPSLDKPYAPGSDVATDDDPAAAQAMMVIASTTEQLLKTIRPAPLALYSFVTSGVTGAAARVASELHVTEALRDSGEKGLHINEIAAKCKTHPLKLGVVLRMLASHWVFKEVRPDVFANNRLSSVLDKGQSIEELQAHPENRYSKPFAGLSAGVDHFGDDSLKMCAHLYEALADPEWAFSSAPNKSAFNKAFDFDGTLWEFYELPDQKVRHDRFKIMMSTAERFDSPELIPKGFEWASLPDGGVVVDVGGGIGNISMKIAKTNPKLKVVCQDMQKTVEAAHAHWKGDEEKAIISSGRVTFQGHDFFAAQPVKNASVFFIKHVLHDWSDDSCLTILRALREAAGPDTKLVVMDKVLPYTCLDQGEGEDVPGYTKPKLPEPLTNVGAATIGFPYMSSLVMMMLGNGQERAIGHYVELFKKGGWKVERVRQFDSLARYDSAVIASPI
ncbi:S-adenosyl-L-methionine-dependent methyltransferase [Schizopora paradoxa]|uniref:S-adenosyl-L-methionine-dependent methyltransferase n=1 Tax=Schizopora paradoxa TaxID=27342 RepID=A0A0H2RPQ0_9AGAM|nr:S-adenosyl-L-methionine-dependent methyltransferase [Schizopora paradoxa]